MPPEPEDLDIDFSQYGVDAEESSVTNDDAAAQPIQQGESEYPSHYMPILEILPGEFKGKVAEQIKVWDQNVGEMTERARKRVREEYADFEDFRAQNIPATQLQDALQISQALEANPVGFLKNLEQMLIARGDYTAAEQVQEMRKDEEQEQQQVYRDPRVDAIEAQQQQLMAAAQHMQQQQFQEQIVQSVDQEFAALEAKIGQMSPQFVREIALRTQTLSTIQGRPVSVEEAFIDFQNTVREARKAQARAPRLPSSGGSSPAAIAHDDTLDGRAAAGQRIVEMMMNNQ